MGPGVVEIHESQMRCFSVIMRLGNYGEVNKYSGLLPKISCDMKTHCSDKVASHTTCKGAASLTGYCPLALSAGFFQLVLDGVGGAGMRWSLSLVDKLEDFVSFPLH